MGDIVVNTRLKISRRMCLILRHQPESVGITLDRDGWTSVSLLSRALNVPVSVIEQIVEDDDKRRYQIEQPHPIGSFGVKRIRCTQGHSTSQVDIQYKEQIPPDCLYHGTSVNKAPIILKDGIKPMDRHYVHLSLSCDTAMQVGSRHGKPAVMVIDATRMVDDGFCFYLADNGVWLTTIVPSKYINAITYSSQGTLCAQSD